MNDQRRQPGSDVGGCPGGSEANGAQTATDDRYGLANLAIIFSTIAGTLADLGPDLSRSQGSSLVDRALALDRVLKGAQEAIGKTRTYLKDCALEALARGNASE